MDKDRADTTDRVDDRVLSAGASGQPVTPCIVHTSEILTETVYWLSADKGLRIGRAPENDVCIRDQSISKYHARIVLSSSGDIYVEDLGSTNGTFVNGEKVVRHALWDGDKVHIGPRHVLKFCYQVNNAPEATDSGEADAPRDNLTGIYAGQFLLKRIDKDFIRAKMRHKDLALLMFDVDGFEEIKETYGPDAGDMVLREVAKLVSSELRQEDIFARYENHTFVIRLRNLNEAAVVALAQRIGRVVKYHPFYHEGKKIRATVSLGIGSLSRNMKSASDLIGEVQAYLEKARRAGHDTINGSQSLRVIFQQMANKHVA